MNKRLYLDGLRQLKIPGIIGTVIMGILAFFTAWGNTFMERSGYTDYYAQYANNPIRTDFASYIPILLIASVIFVPIMMIVQFSFLHKRNSSDFYHALPVRRETLYFTYLAAVMSWAAVMILIATGIIAAIYGLDACHTLTASTVGLAVLTSLVIACLVCSVFAVGVSATGTGFTNVCVAAILLIVPRCIMIAVMLGITESVRTMSYDYIDGFFGIRCNALFHVGYTYLAGIFGTDDIELPGAMSLCYTFVLSAIYAGWGLVVFRKRKSEVASLPNFNKAWQAVTRTIPAFCLSAIGTFLVAESILGEMSIGSDEGFWVCLLYVAATITYFIYELITSKKWKAVAEAWKTFPFLILANVIFLLAIVIPTNCLRNERIEADKVQAVEVVNTYSSDTTYKKLWESIGEKEDRELVELLVTAYNDTMECYYNSGMDIYSYYEVVLEDGFSADRSITASFVINGRRVTREFYLSSEMVKELNAIAQTYTETENVTVSFPSLKEIRYFYLEYGCGCISDEALDEIYESWTSEAGTTLERYIEVNAAQAMMYLTVRSDDFYSFPISEQTPSTLNMILELIREADPLYCSTEVPDLSTEREDDSSVEIICYDYAGAFGYDYLDKEISFRINRMEAETFLSEYAELLANGAGHDVFSEGDLIIRCEPQETEALTVTYSDGSTVEQWEGVDYQPELLIFNREEWDDFAEEYPVLAKYIVEKDILATWLEETE